MRVYPIDRLMIRITLWRWRHGTNGDFFETGTIRINACQPGKHPFANRAKGIVGERVHRGVLSTPESILFRVAVPAFPDRSRPLLDFVSPGRILMALEQTGGEVMLSK